MKDGRVESRKKKFAGIIVSRRSPIYSVAVLWVVKNGAKWRKECELLVLEDRK